MARRRSRKSSLLEDLSRLPWWVSVALAGVIYVSFKFILPSFEMNSSMAKMILPAISNTAGIFALVLLVPALISLFRQWSSKPPPTTRKKPTVNTRTDGASSHENQSTLSSEKPSKWTHELLGRVEWKRFEELCRAYFETKGFTSRTTRVGADGGVDINLYKGDLEKPVVLVQCKAWNTYKVGVKPVRELFGVMAASSVSHGIFMTTGEFTREAKEFAKEKCLALMPGSSLYRSIMEMPQQTQITLLSVAIEGDYTTPTCASCNTKMVLRTSKSGKNVGSSFWGCINYPRCRKTLRHS